jgi:hypothetical protein
MKSSIEISNEIRNRRNAKKKSEKIKISDDKIKDPENLDAKINIVKGLNLCFYRDRIIQEEVFREVVINFYNSKNHPSKINYEKQLAQIEMTSNCIGVVVSGLIYCDQKINSNFFIGLGLSLITFSSIGKIKNEKIKIGDAFCSAFPWLALGTIKFLSNIDLKENIPLAVCGAISCNCLRDICIKPFSEAENIRRDYIRACLNKDLKPFKKSNTDIKIPSQLTMS